MFRQNWSQQYLSELDSKADKDLLGLKRCGLIRV